MQIATEQRAPWHKTWKLSKPGSGVHQQASAGISSHQQASAVIHALAADA